MSDDSQSIAPQPEREGTPDSSPPPLRSERFYSKESSTTITDDLIELSRKAFSTALSREKWLELVQSYSTINDTDSFLIAPKVEAVVLPTNLGISPFVAATPVEVSISTHDNQPNEDGHLLTDNWKTITQDNLVLQTVVGYKIPFTSAPRKWRPRITTTRSSIQQKRMETAIQTLLKKAAIKAVQPAESQFISSLFLVEKVQWKGEIRPIINLKPLNRFVEEWSFKMEEGFRVPMPPIRVEISPSTLHQANDSSHSPYPEFGNTNCHLPGRHSHLTSGSQCSVIYLQEGCEPSRGSGIPHQPEQMFSVPISAAYLLGNNTQHCHNVPVFADREAGSHPTGSTPATYQRQEYTTGVSSTPGTHEPCSSEWHLVGFSALQSTSEGSLSWDPKSSQDVNDISMQHHYSRHSTKVHSGRGLLPFKLKAQ
ncbi:Hypothetical predicted protein [Paramuricea clavata]|uniref:Uncharacterized protein n=1 Tax=Paramuricea clavata TaxID=317549 RepID=A0A7D9DLL6_PARCT|nr:Hypothetical predicted protein [Paramuricea clavata]